MRHVLDYDLLSVALASVVEDNHFTALTAMVQSPVIA
jgi:hypothetical protein